MSNEVVDIATAAKARKRRRALVGAEGGEDAPLDFRLACLDKNDMGNAERLRARFGQDLIYVDEIGWLWWDERRWSAEVGSQQAELLAQRTAAAIKDEAWALQKAPRDRRPSDSVIDAHVGWAVTSGNNARLASMIDTARPHLTKRPEELDSDDDLLVLRNGTIKLGPDCRLETEHRRSDLVTKIVDVDYDPGAECPHFMKFLERIQPDKAIRDFLQRSFGYSLTGQTGEQVMWFLHGGGANGKSTLINVVARILGPYCVSLPFSSLVQDERARGADATPDLARLPGARMVRASEPQKGAKLGEDTVKKLTGGEEITARNLNRGFFDFDPKFKLFLSGNHKPIIRGQDEGIWRRMLLVPFRVSIPKDERRNHKVLDAELWAERSGIFNWMLDGYLHWLEIGLAAPEAVLVATQEYREDSDRIGMFLSQWCERVPEASIQAIDLYDAYQLFCRENADDPVSNTAFGRMLPERGIEKDKRGTVRYLGLQLTEFADRELCLSRSKKRGKGSDDG